MLVQDVLEYVRHFARPPRQLLEVILRLRTGMHNGRRAARQRTAVGGFDFCFGFHSTLTFVLSRQIARRILRQVCRFLAKRD